MTYQADQKLKLRLRGAGLTYRDVAAELGETPSTVAARINGWLADFSYEQRKRIEKLIESKRCSLAA